MNRVIRFFKGQRRKIFTLEEFQHMVYIIMGMIHVFYLFLFCVTGIYFMAVVDVCSILVYILAYRFSSPRYGTLAFKLAYYEVIMHLILVTFMIGDRCGFGLYCMAFVPVTYFFFYLFSQQEETKNKWFDPLYYSIFSMMVYVLLKIYIMYRNPCYDFLSDRGKTILFTVNFVMVIFSLIFFMGVSVVQYLTMQERLEQYAHEDPLTGLANRRSINEVMELAYSLKKRFAVILCDIDDFKIVNDTYGHEFGDYILVSIAEYMRNSMRKTDSVCRWGGEEILIYTANCDAAQASVIAEKFRKGVKELNIENRGFHLEVTLTLGVADSTEADSLTNLIHKADQRLYIGKQEGKDRVIHNDQPDEGENEWDMKQHSKMRGLSEKNLFEGLSNTSDNVYLFENDMKNGISRWSDNAVKYFGLPSDYATNTLNIWMDHIHPEDRESYLEDVELVFQGKKNRHCCQYRARNAEGNYVWLECTGNVICNEQKEPTFFVGLMTRIDNQSKFDPITKCLSSSQFQQSLITEDCTMVLIGLDEFRKVVNIRGYEDSNDVLRAVVDSLKEMDEKMLIYRMTGDEFLIVQKEQTQIRTEKQIQSWFESYLTVFQKLCRDRGFSGSLTFSGGAIRYDCHAMSKDDAIRKLEHSMEHAKAIGRGLLVFYSEEIEEKHTREQQLKDALVDSMEHAFYGFEVYYQPITRATDGKIVGVEALLRFHSDMLGIVQPSEFIPLLEQSLDIRKAGIWIMKEIVRQKAAWKQKYPELRISFNVSYLQLYNDEFVDCLIETVKQSGIDPRYFIVELTESCKVEYPDMLASMMNRLEQHGFSVALDDFGMEHSSFTLVRDLPVDYIKIDHSFVRTLTTNETPQDKINLAIISSINYLCKTLHKSVVVEGIENEDIAQVVSDMGVGYLQGYYFSRPVPVHEIEKLLDQSNS